jgi:hypothetical protein
VKIPTVLAGAFSYLGVGIRARCGTGRKAETAAMNSGPPAHRSHAVLDRAAALARVDGDVELLGRLVKLFLPALDGPPPRRGGRPEIERLKPALAGLITEVAR